MSSIHIPSGVGQTAIFIAWQRNVESQRADALFRDPFAAVLLEHLEGTPTFAHVSEVARQADHPQYFAVRTRYFDDEILAGLRSGARQVVTLAAGMDGRPARLPTPPATRWFELDLPEMIAVKCELLQRSALTIACDWRPVPADLTTDWSTPLLAAGFDPAQPTIWLVEGLLMYLSLAAGDALLRRLSELSARGSRLLVEQLQALMMTEEGRPARELVESQGARWLSARDDIQEWLSEHGWDATVHAGSDPKITHGRSVAQVPACWIAAASLVR